MKRVIWIVTTLAMTAATAVANDGPFLSVPAGGILFKKTDAVSMEKEELFISEDLIRVSYVFRNTTPEEFKTEVAFPLPVYGLGDFEGMKPNYAKFTVKVDGQPVEYRTINRAVMVENPDKKWPVPTRGDWKVAKDVTEIVAKHGLTGDPEKVWEKLDALSDAAKTELIEAGVMAKQEDRVFPVWFVQTAYVWEQVFPSNAELRVEHEYEPQRGYLGEWHLDPFYERVNNRTLEYDKVPKFGSAEFVSQTSEFQKRFEIDQSVLGWAKKQLAANKRFSFVVVDYILTTAAYWKGPIKEFTLTIEKPGGATPVAVSTAVEGLKKTGDHRFQVKKKDFVPEKDLSILFIHALDPF
ncbi:MAG: hypothetical protein AMXMBFR84_05000 [Candidatus Hydrogenedentota bacterium]